MVVWKLGLRDSSKHYLHCFYQRNVTAGGVIGCKRNWHYVCTQYCRPSHAFISCSNIAYCMPDIHHNSFWPSFLRQRNHCNASSWGQFTSYSLPCLYFFVSSFFINYCNFFIHNQIIFLRTYWSIPPFL